MTVMTYEREGYIWHRMPERVRRAVEKDRRAFLTQARRRVQGNNIAQNKLYPRTAVDRTSVPFYEKKYYDTPSQNLYQRGGSLRRDSERSTSLPKEDTPSQTLYQRGGSLRRDSEHSTSLPREDTPSQKLYQRGGSLRRDSEHSTSLPREGTPSQNLYQRVGSLSRNSEYSTGQPRHAEQAQLVKEELPPKAHARSSSAGTSSRRSKTKHTVQFRGPRWAQVLRGNRDALEEAFKRDVWDASGLSPKAMEDVTYTMTDVLSITFIARHTPENRVADLHSLLQKWKFPATTALYPEKRY